jgi:DNA-binding SARP family transcriptional activator
LARRLDAVAIETWLRLRLTAEPGRADPRVVPVTVAEPPLTLRCFGRFEFVVSGVPRDTSKLRRQARTVLWLLSLHVSKAVQEETLTSTIWPDVSTAKAKHRLHVAISSLRRVLDPGARPRASDLIVRVGSSYVLSPPPGSEVDLLVFESSIRRWRLTRSDGPIDELTRTLSAALDAYRGDLLTEAGPAEWVLAERDRLRTEAANAAAALAALQLDHDPHLAVEACMSGLRIDDLHYGLWRLLAEAHTRAGNRAEAARAHQAYADLMNAV